jgi:predicted Ser/Thr protein kinase
MPQIVLCPHGHRSEVSTQAAGSPDSPLLCPVCGVRVEPATEAETIPPASPIPVAETASIIAVRSQDAPTIAGYEILNELGRGGMGIVYRARQPHLDRLVAIKVLPAEASKDSSFTERFTREARALARLNHPHILTVYDFGQAEEQSYFVMEYVDGTNLRQRLRAGPLPVADVLQIVSQVCEALQYAHEEGIVHRDIKPENILLDRKGRVKIADFGIAKLLTRKPGDYTLTGPWQVMGTFHYMAPEQLENPQQLDQRADIYSVGVMLYELLTGSLPQGHFPLPSQKVRCDARLDAVVLKALEKEPERRYQNAGELKAAMDTLQRPATAIPVAVAIPVAEVVEKTAVLSTPVIAFSTPEAWARRVRGVARWLVVAGFLSGLPSAIYGFLQSVNDFRPMYGDQFGWYLASVPPILGVLVICAGFALYRRRFFWLAALGSFISMLPYMITWPVGVVAGVGGIVTLGRRDIRRAYRLPAWPDGSRSMPPLLAAWMSNINVWYMICAAVGVFFCVQPFWPWVVQGFGRWRGFGYSAAWGFFTGGTFLALFLLFFVTGRMKAWPIAYAFSAVVAGGTVVGILGPVLRNQVYLKEAISSPSVDTVHVWGAMYWALAMGVALLLLSAIQFRGLLAARRPAAH